MYRMLSAVAVFVVLLMTGLLKAEDPPTPEQVSENPQKYVGQTIVFDRMRLDSEVKTSPGRFRFKVTSQHGTEFGTENTRKQRITFRTPDKSEDVKEFISTMKKAGQDYTARLTCKITQGKGRLAEIVAVVQRVDVIRFTEKVTGDVLDGVTPEQINENPKRYVGNMLVLDGVTLTAVVRLMNDRTAIEVKSPTGTMFATTENNKQSLLFTIREKDKVARKYLADELTGDLSRPLRVTVEVLNFGEKAYRADVKGIDLIGYQHDQPESFDIEAVENNVRRYEGRLLTFNDVRLVGGLVTKEKFTLASVRTANGTRIPADLRVDGLSFIVPVTVELKLSPGVKEGKELPVHLTCRIRKDSLSGNYWFAEVLQVEFLADGADGMVRKTVDAVPPEKDADGKKGGITGKWQGNRNNEYQSDLGQDWLFVRECQDGKILGEWWGMSIKNGVRVSDDLVTWEAEGQKREPVTKSAVCLRRMVSRSG